MHYVCSTFGSAGDVFPMLGLALQLRDRGHEVTFATNANYAELVAGYGLPFEPLGTRAEFQACIAHADLWHPGRAFRHVYQSIRPALRRQYEIHAECAARGPVAGITNVFGFGALVAQDHLQIPVITLHLQPAVLWSDLDPPALPGLFGPRWLKRLVYGLAERFVVDPVVCPDLNRWRSELGLPPIRQTTRSWNSRGGVVCLFPEWYAPPKPDWPAPLVQTDFPLWNHQSNQGLSSEVEAFLHQGDRPIVFTPGSTNLHGQDFFSAAVTACQSLGTRGILLTEYPEQLPHRLPETVRHFSYVPLDLLLPHAAAFVYHGGIGSMSQGMLAGIPHVQMPLAHDQFDNAARITRLGIGRSVPARKFNARRLTDALSDLLGNAEVSRACADVQQRLAPRDGLRRAAETVIEWTATPGRRTTPAHSLH